MKKFLFLLMPLVLTACGSNKPHIDPSDEKVSMRQNYKDYTKNSVFNNCSATPSKGNVNLLIIPIWFNDSNNFITDNTKKNNVREDITKAYLGTNEEVGYRSVKTYYEEESSNKLSVSGKVTNWYNTGKDSSYYKDDEDKTIELLQSVVNWAKTSEHINPTDYDTDKDGYLDSVIMVYARPDFQAKGEGENNFWAYCGYDQSQSPRPSNPVASVYFWASYDFMYQKNDNYTKARTGTGYGNGYTYRQILDTETFIHEMGHMFGLDDYYDYAYEVIPGGRYTMQDENVSTHDPFSYIALNWADPYIPTKSCTITIGDFATTHDVILLTPEWNSYDSPFDEYILLELYSLTGLNEMYKGDTFHGINLPDAVGIRVWHVDARLMAFDYQGYGHITSNVNDYSCVYRLADNTHNCIWETFPDEQFGSFLCENQNALQLISQDKTRNYGIMSQDDRSKHFVSQDLFTEGDSFSLDAYKKQFIDIDMNKCGELDNGKYYKDSDYDIRLNNQKKLGWSFKVDDITTVNGASTATITLTKLA